MPSIEHLTELAPNLPSAVNHLLVREWAAQCAPLFAVGLIAWHTLRAYRSRAQAQEKLRERAP